MPAGGGAGGRRANSVTGYETKRRSRYTKRRRAVNVQAGIEHARAVKQIHQNVNKDLESVFG